MILRKVMAAGVLFLFLGNYSMLSGFETDQYNLPPVPLADISEEMSEYVEDNIRAAIEKLNATIAMRLLCVENRRPSAECDEPEKESRELDRLRSDEAIAREVFKLLGSGIFPSTRSQTWVNSHKFRSQPARYKTGYAKSIYVLIPTNYLTISPTVNMYGSSFGSDKIGHIFQQGYGYYKTRRKEIAGGKSLDEAERKAVRRGVFAEHTYYGTLVGGVFSNADLAANYIGMMFYEGLTENLSIGDVNRPAAVELKDGKWSFNAAVRPQLLKPFISDHLNEALNPSLFIPGLRSSVRKVVRKQSCPEWQNLYPGRKRQEYEGRSKELTQWNGEDYGFRDSNKFVTIANTCF